MKLEDVKIGFIGGGNMARAIAEGLIKKGLVKSSEIYVSAPSASTIQKWNELGVRATHQNGEVIFCTDIIFLSFKPYQLDRALGDAEKWIPNEEPKSLITKLFVSVLVGVTLDTLFSKLTRYIKGTDVRLIRTLPNTAMAVGEGCSAISPHESALKEDVDIISEIYSALGKCEVVPEYLIPPISGLSGSGIAYIYSVIEALSDGGVKQGVPRELSTKFAAQTVLGAAKMVLETKKHPGELKDQVCSPGGTTICGIHALEKGGLRSALIDAVEAAVKKGEEIANLNK